VNRRTAGAVIAMLAGSALVGGPAVGPAFAAPPPGACLTQTKPHDPRPERPWEDKLLDPARVWSVTRGAGVRVGVIDSGVDGDNPQLRGKVFPGWDFVRDQAGARFDCAPHGTPVASIIAGAQLEGTGFHGLAPDARIVPARVTDADEIKGGPAIVATAIRYTVDNGATVLNLSLTVFQDVPEIKQAVEYAQAHDVLVVAAAGNNHDQGNPRPYPAAYPGVLGVGSIDIAGARAPDSQAGDYVDLVAPGVKVTGCDPGAGQELWQGTSFATPFVSGTAALVRSAWPRLTADQVAERLIRTASAARGGADSPEYGAGVVNPYRAVTDTTVDGAAAPARSAPVPAQQTDPVAQRHEAAVAAADRQARHAATTLLGVTVGGLAVAGLVIAGRRRARRPPESNVTFLP
jgi:type VII secretion-associated serine protease mycosin